MNDVYLLNPARTLTPTQQGYLAWIDAYIAEKDVFPTLREVAIAMCNGNNTVALAALNMLERKGMIERIVGINTSSKYTRLRYPSLDGAIAFIVKDASLTPDLPVNSYVIELNGNRIGAWIPGEEIEGC